MERIKTRALLCGLVIALAASAGPPAPAQLWWEPPEKGEGAVDELKVDAAITLGVEYLKRKQRPDGSFPGHDKAFPMGMTSLCLLTLVKCGVQPLDPAVTNALKYVRYMPFRKTYSTGCMLMALEALHPKDAKAWAEAGVKFLLETRDVAQGGRWSYPNDAWKSTGKLGYVDLSNSQYAILGLRSARRLGVKVPPEAFTDLVAFLTKDQREQGAFRYRGDHDDGTGSMSTAALAIITIAEQEAGKSRAFKKIRGDAKAAFKKGLLWFEKNYTVEWNPHGDTGSRSKNNLAYYLYGIERLCDIRGMKTVGDHRWYDDGARFLLANQRPNGSWGSNENTCFALLFLRRAHLSISRELRTESVAERRKELNRRRRSRGKQVRPPDPREVPFVRDWLVLGPFAVKDENAMDPRRHPRVKGRPKAGAVARNKRWQLLESGSDAVNLEEVLKPGHRRVAYVASYFYVPREAPVILWLGSPHGWRVWVNGDEVMSRQVKGMGGKDRWRMAWTFRKGFNNVMVLLEDGRREWNFHFRVSDPEGRAIPGLLHAPSTARLKRMVNESHRPAR